MENLTDTLPATTSLPGTDISPTKALLSRWFPFPQVENVLVPLKGNQNFEENHWEKIIIQKTSL